MARTIRSACTVLACGWLAACADRRDSAVFLDAAPDTRAADEALVGRAGATAFTLSEIRSPVELSLYDLEIQQFRLLRDAAEAALMASLDATGGGIAELSLSPPLPPRLDVEPDPQRMRRALSAEDARPVTLLVFCNFESPHCARLQIQLDSLLQLYPDVLELAVRDFELPFHRSAGLAAEASRCALEQEAFWPFHDALYANPGALDRARLERTAATAGLDAAAFATCLDSGRWSAAVRADTAVAAGLGVSLVPLVFVNGLYTGPQPGSDLLIWLIERELERVGAPSPRLASPVRQSQTPITVQALIHSTTPGQGLVLAGTGGALSVTALFREGDALTPSLILRRVTDRGIELLNAGVAETLAFGAGASTAGEPGTATDAANAAGAALITTPHVAVPVTLDRNEVLVRLTDPAGLANVLEPVAMRAGDYRLVRLTAIVPGSLYELLGFEVGDVIVGVNEQPVHEADMPLWRALEREDEVRVRVMRAGGVAKHFTFRFDD